MDENGDKKSATISFEQLNNAAGTVSILVAVSLIVSITYDTGFLIFARVSIAKIPTTISDHFRSAVIWFPNAVLVVFGVIAAELMVMNSRKSDNTKDRKSKNIAKKLICCITILFILMFIIFGDIALPFLYGSISISWCMFYNLLMKYDSFFKQKTKLAHAILCISPAVIIMIFGLGASDAYVTLSSKPSVTIRSKANKFILLRVFERGMLLYDKYNAELDFVDNNGDIIYKSNASNYDFYEGVSYAQDFKNRILERNPASDE